MNRTIFEIPEEIQGMVLKTLEDYQLNFFCSRINGTNMVELAITHSKSQNYIIEIIENQMNQLLTPQFQVVS